MALNKKIAYIDLSLGKIETKPIPEKLRRLYLGGRGLDMYLLYNHLKPGTDPLSADNISLISAGLLGGTPAPASGRCHVGGKSPVTGCVGSSNMGGFFAPELRFAGFDHLLIKGKAEKPVYLWIHNGEIEIRDASHLWGKDTFDTQRIIREKLGDRDIKVLCIGQAGENLVRYANIRTGLKNTAGRTGIGCILGSKNLKAVAVRGTMNISLAHPVEALEYCRQVESQIMSTKVASALGQDGTMFIWNVTNTTGLLRYRNLQSNTLEDWESLTIERFKEKYDVGRTGCFGCQVGCRHRWEIKDGPYSGLYGEGPEYNTQMCLGGTVGVTNWETVLYGSHLVDKYGVDMAELGSILAWAMELYQLGYIDKKVTEGLDLDWSNADSIVPVIIEQVAFRRGFGAKLADGPLAALKNIASEVGKEEELAYYLLHIKGQSSCASDERATPALALGIATSTRGADHLRSRPAIDLLHLPTEVLEAVFDGGPMSSDYTSYVGKSREIWVMERVFEVVDSLGLCKFQSIFFSPHTPNFEEYSKLVYYITGLDISPEELREIGERAYTIERMFNYREMGMTRKDDYLPERYYKEKTPAGLPVVKGRCINRKRFDKMLDEYYELHGWDENGIPRPETLSRLGIDKEPSHML